MSEKTVALSPVAFGDGARIHPASSSHGIPLPPASLMWSIGAPSLDSFLAIADAWNGLADRFLSEEACVLDAGCGRVARPLIQDARVRRYIGFDVIRENVAWCREYLASPAKEPRRLLLVRCAFRPIQSAGARVRRRTGLPLQTRGL